MAQLSVFIEEIFFMMVVFHSFNLLSTYYVSGTLLGAGNAKLKEKDETPWHREVYILAKEVGSEQYKQVNHTVC